MGDRVRWARRPPAGTSAPVPGPTAGRGFRRRPALRSAKTAGEFADNGRFDAASNTATIGAAWVPAAWTDSRRTGFMGSSVIRPHPQAVEFIVFGRRWREPRAPQRPRLKSRSAGPICPSTRRVGLGPEVRIPQPSQVVDAALLLPTHVKYSLCSAWRSGWRQSAQVADCDAFEVAGEVGAGRRRR